MPSTYTSLHCHIVFSTKDRHAWIDELWIERLHAYMGGVLKGLRCQPHIIGGVADHVHILVGFPATITISDLVRDLKKAATGWIRDEMGKHEFSWQVGYAAFSVSANDMDDVRCYIANQAEHHRKVSFLDELVSLLEAAGVEYDPRYLD